MVNDDEKFDLPKGPRGVVLRNVKRVNFGNARIMGYAVAVDARDVEDVDFANLRIGNSAEFVKGLAQFQLTADQAVAILAEAKRNGGARSIPDVARRVLGVGADIAGIASFLSAFLR